jgi:hypothetical protein
MKQKYQEIITLFVIKKMGNFNFTFYQGVLAIFTAKERVPSNILCLIFRTS